MSSLDQFVELLERELRRGMLRLIILKIVADGDVHGYAIMDRMKEITNAQWRPSPGSVYPALRDLESFGLIAAETDRNRKVYRLTPDGREILKLIAEYVGVVMKDLQQIFGDLIEKHKPNGE